MDPGGVRKPSEGKRDGITGEPNNNAGRTEKPAEEEIPKIFHSEVKDVFPLFANMLDIKSFTLLSRANKKMYKMCKEDKRITINVMEEEMVLSGRTETLEFSLIRSEIRLSQMDNYITTLRRLQCNVTLNVLIFQNETGTQCITATRNYLEEIGVKRIERIVVFGGFSEWPKIFDFIKDFHVTNVALPGNIPLNHLKSLLKMELASLSYNGDTAPSVLLVVDSPIREIYFYGRKSISNDVFLQILWKIQTGPLEKLTIKTRSVNWSSFKPLDFYHAGPLSDDRPLAFSIRHPTNLNFWFLHWHGEVTKCFGRKGPHGDELVTIKKCKESEYPPAVRKKETVFEDFNQKRPKINCTLAHFRSFFENYTVLDPSHKGPLPEERPLLCKDKFHSYKESEGHWVLNEDGTMESVSWTNDNAVVYEQYDMKSKWPSSCRHPVLAKYLFIRMLKETMVNRTLHCGSVEQFNSWFEGLTMLPFNSRGPLPEERPLVFEKKGMSSRGRMELRVVLFADESIVECSHQNTSANLHRCPSWDLPPVLISSEKLNDIIQNAPMQKVIGMPMALELFRSGFHGFKTLPFDHNGLLPADRPLVLEKTEFDEGYVTERRWFLREKETVVCTWKYDRADFKTGIPEEYPVALTKGLINECITKDSDKFPSEGVFLDLDAFRSCFREFRAISFGFRGMLPEERPLIFGAPATNSSIFRVWILCKGERFLSFTWGENKVVCNRATQPKDIPPALKTMEYLKILMQTKWEKGAKHHVLWYGDRLSYTNFFNDKSFTKLRNSHSGPLPEKRPIVFVGPNRRYFLREDGTAIQCHWLKEDVAEIHVPPTFYDIPHNLMDLAFPK